MTDRRARAQLWNRLRLLVIDLETTVEPDKTFHVVSMGAVICYKGKIESRWSAPLIDPGVPIDSNSIAVHHLTDANVKDQPKFAALVDQIMPLLRTVGDERLVLVAHNVRFDIPLLRLEMERAGENMPDLPVIDTMGNLAALAGVVPDGKKLAALLTALGIANTKPHDAAADAEATASAVIELLNRAADAGHDRIEELYDGRSAALSFAGPSYHKKGVTAPTPSPEHLAGHAKVLPVHPGKRALAAWLDAVSECAQLRCDLLADRVANAAVPTDILLVRLRLLSDGPAIATLLGALLPRFTSLPHRRAAVALDRSLAPFLDVTPRCEETDLCPACRADEPCPLDVWRVALAAAIGCAGNANQANGFFVTSGHAAGTGGYAKMSKTNRRLADTALRLTYRYWVEHDHSAKAVALARLALETGCLDPEIAGAYAHVLATGGRLEMGRTLCDRVLATRHNSTDPAWAGLEMQSAAIEGQRQRLQVRYTTDDAGNSIPVRRHHPEFPHRTRTPRFLRPAAHGVAPASASQGR
jgi:DNA polymerase III epsilon subunit-like protein